jgi:8-oxo-dGTP pyrophosphatase MutT (NUDIX family)
MNGLISRAALNFYVTLRALSSPVAFGVSALAFDRDGRVLLVRHSYQPGWMLPGGGVGRAERPADAIKRELFEEVGLMRSGTPEFIALYTRNAGWVTNHVALYRLVDVEIDFKPNLEIRAVTFADPRNLPSGTTPPVARRIQELHDALPRTGYW